MKDLNSLPVTEKELYSTFTINLLVIKQIRLFFDGIPWFVRLKGQMNAIISDPLAYTNITMSFSTFHTICDIIFLL